MAGLVETAVVVQRITVLLRCIDCRGYVELLGVLPSLLSKPLLICSGLLLGSFLSARLHLCEVFFELRLEFALLWLRQVATAFALVQWLLVVVL